jgi:hypothetical protein
LAPRVSQIERVSHLRPDKFVGDDVLGPGEAEIEGADLQMLEQKLKLKGTFELSEEIGDGGAVPGPELFDRGAVKKGCGADAV